MNFQPNQEVYTQERFRVYLRELKLTDVSDNYLSWFKDSSVTEFLYSRNLTRKDVENYIRQGKESESHYMYGIFDIDSHDHIGNIKIGPINWNDRVSDLVCVIGNRDYWGKGIAREAIKIGNRIAFEIYDMRKVSGGIASKNLGSIKAYTGANWIIEGTMKGHHLVNGEAQDRILVSCFNPKYFPCSE